jgi:predicted PurR-regulated permease PerM
VTDGPLQRVRLHPGFTAIIAAVLLLWLAGTVADLLVLLFVSVLAAVYLSAMTDLLCQRTGMPRSVAFVVTMVASTAALVGITALLVPPVVEQSREIAAALPVLIPQWEAALQRVIGGIPGLRDLLPAGDEAVVGMAVSELQKLSTTLLPRLVGTFQLAIDLIAVLVMALYVALHPQVYRDLIVSLTPPRHRATTQEVLDAIAETLRAWTIAQLLVMIILALLTWVGLVALQVPYALAFGIFTGLVAIVPFFGTFVSTVLPALFVLPGPDGGTQAVLVLILGTVIHLVGSHLIVPLLMHRKVDIPPVLTIMAVLIGGRLLGAVGLVVAVPLLAVSMVLLRRVLVARIYGDAATTAVVRPVAPRRHRSAPPG